MFEFLIDMGNHDQRVVARHEYAQGIIDTAFCSDNPPDTPYETGIKDKRYRKDGEWIIVELYASKKDAKTGHAKWVRCLTKGKPPQELHDVGGGGIGQLANAMGATTVYPRR